MASEYIMYSQNFGRLFELGTELNIEILEQAIYGNIQNLMHKSAGHQDAIQTQFKSGKSLI